MNIDASCFIFVLSILTVAQANMDWVIYKKISDFSQTLTLFCKLKDCCKETAGWVKWVSGINFDTLVLSVKETSFDEDAKYDGRIGKNGFYLMIRNVSSNDFGANYSCTYGINSSPKKLLKKADAFVVQTEIRRSMERTKEDGDNKTLVVCLIILACVVIIVIPALIFLSFRLYKAKNGNRNLNTIETNVNNEDASLVRLNNLSSPSMARTGDIVDNEESSLPQAMSISKAEMAMVTSQDQEYSFNDSKKSFHSERGGYQTVPAEDDNDQTVLKQTCPNVVPYICTPEGYATNNQRTNVHGIDEYKSSTMPRKPQIDNPTVKSDKKYQNVSSDTSIKLVESGRKSASSDMLDREDRFDEFHKNTEHSTFDGYVKSQIDSLKSSTTNTSMSMHILALTKNDTDESELTEDENILQQ